MRLLRVIRPDGTAIKSEPGINMEFALWNAREVDDELAKVVKRNQTNNVTLAKRKGYTFEEVAR